MKKLLPLLILLTAVTFSACTGSNEDTSSDPQAETVEQAMEKTSDAAGSEGMSKKTIRDFLSMGDSMKCTYSSSDGSSTVYTDGTRVNIEGTSVISETENKEMTFHMINDGEWVYTWSSDSDTGMKMDPNKMEEEADDLEDNLAWLDAGGEEGDDMESEEEDFIDEDYKYECTNWNVDSSLFIPPSNITFTDFSVVMDDIQEGMQDLSAVCDMLSGTDKQECLDSF